MREKSMLSFMYSAKPMLSGCGSRGRMGLELEPYPLDARAGSVKVR